MTRETKIGLLVGLAFIIVIGILLSDYNRIESPNAPLYGTAKDVSNSVAAPGNTPPTRTTIVYPPRPVTPRQPVPTVEDLAPRPNVQDEVVVRPGNQQTLNADENSSRGVVIGPANISNEPRGVKANNGVPPDLQNLPRGRDLELVPVGTGSQPTPPTQKPAMTVAGKQYTAEPGDTVSKMAGRFMGANTKANREAIVAANPSLQKNINNVIVGRAYVIPPSGAAAGPSSVALAPKAQPTPPPVQTPVNQPQSTPTHWYTVKENDSLWRIAQEQLGDGSAVAAIKELNKEVLKGADVLHPNMRLRLPAKPLASAS